MKVDHAQGTPLSDREIEILYLVADGVTNYAIAKAMFLSVHTIRDTIVSIRGKLGARDRAHAVAIGFRQGLLVASPDWINTAPQGVDHEPVSA